jgi:hypothetical protein
MCSCAFIRRCNSHCTVLSVTAVEIGSSWCRAVIDDEIGLSTKICLEIAQQTSHLSRRHGGQLLAFGDTVERDQRFANEIEGPSNLAVPQTPANPIDDFNEIRTRLAIVRGDVRPAFGRLISMLNRIERWNHAARYAAGLVADQPPQAYC